MVPSIENPRHGVDGWWLASYTWVPATGETTLVYRRGGDGVAGEERVVKAQSRYKEANVRTDVARRVVVRAPSPG